MYHRTNMHWITLLLLCASCACALAQELTGEDLFSPDSPEPLDRLPAIPAAVQKPGLRL
jgi:hypothetical protein